MRRFLIAAAMICHAAFATATPDPPFRFDGVERIVVIADVHGAYDPLVGILRETGVVDDSLHWSAGHTHLVALGDFMDRGPDSRKVLELLMRLEGEAAAAGGALHPLLGNHEVMNLSGDLRYVSPPEYAAYSGAEDATGREASWRAILAKDPSGSRAEFETAFPPGYFGHLAAFAPQGRYGRWLMDKPVLIVINDTAFVHAGLPPLVAKLGLEETNESLHAELRSYLAAWRTTADSLGLVRPIGFLERPEALAAMPAPAEAEAIATLQDGPLFTPDGPTWFRGQALCYSYTETANLDAALAKLGVNRVIEGHTVTPTGRVLRRFDGRVVLLDTGMLAPVYHGRASAMVFERGAWSVAYADAPGQRSQPVAAPRAVGPRPGTLDDDALERWLTEAEVVSVEKLDAGITHAQRVTLRKDDVELRAVFKQVSIGFDDADRAGTTFDSDRYQDELAAYRLDRLLGLDMVPVTVERTIGGRHGILQFWIDGSMNLRQMLEQKLAPSGWCPANPQYNLMNVFDLLIHNTDRTQGNALFTRDWMLVLTDHTRAFGTDSKEPVLLYRNPVELPPALAQRLAALDRPTLDAALGRYLNRRQIDALLKRRDALLRRYGAPAVAGRAAAR
jgi:Calcineurin-like phosphoesterase